MKTLSGLWKKNKALILYLVFGGLTTLVNIAAYALFFNLLKFGNVVSTALAWFFSVLFAYLTNRIFVFESENAQTAAVMKEILSFFGCRIGTGLLDLGIMYAAVDVLSRNSMVWKIISNGIVIVLNYAASKLLIFRKHG